MLFAHVQCACYCLGSHAIEHALGREFVGGHVDHRTLSRVWPTKRNVKVSIDAFQTRNKLHAPNQMHAERPDPLFELIAVTLRAVTNQGK
jgi:hypothetical protein